eukprot:11332828-Alexandrium_andersonii.AAC.1
MSSLGFPPCLRPGYAEAQREAARDLEATRDPHSLRVSDLAWTADVGLAFAELGIAAAEVLSFLQ